MAELRIAGLAVFDLNGRTPLKHASSDVHHIVVVSSCLVKCLVQRLSTRFVVTNLNGQVFIVQLCIVRRLHGVDTGVRVVGV